MKDSNSFVSIKKSASILGISTVTLRNWIKAKIVKSENGFIEKKEILKLKKGIESGEINKLKSRANRDALLKQKYIFPKNIEITQQKTLKLFLNRVKKEIKTIEAQIYFIIIRKLKQIGYIKKDYIIKTAPVVKDIKNIQLFNILNSFFYKFKKSINNNSYNQFDNENFLEIDGILTILYQNLKNENFKSKSGVYYTPINVVKEMVENIDKKNLTILDPCCGTGVFLIESAKKLKQLNSLNPLKQIYGVDIDPISIFITKVELYLLFPNYKDQLNIFNENFLSINFDKKFDRVISNPPWGAKIDNFNYKNCKIKGVTESFSCFTIKSIDHLKKGGLLSFLYPDSILGVKKHRFLREYLVKNLSIQKIVYEGNIFKHVVSPVVRIDIKKVEKRGVIDIFYNQNYQIDQNRFKNRDSYIFDIQISSKDYKIIDKIYNKKHITLKNRAKWALGIVTGDNKKFISALKSSNYEPIITGSDITPFSIKAVSKFIDYKRDQLQQVAEDNLYRYNSKLVYRFISNKPIFAIDKNRYLTLNSANIVIPQIENYPYETIISFFNSKLYQYLYQKLFKSVKVLKGDLEKMAIPIISGDKHQLFINFIKNNSNKFNKESLKELDKIVFSFFDLTDEEINYIILH